MVKEQFFKLERVENGFMLYDVDDGTLNNGIPVSADQLVNALIEMKSAIKLYADQFLAQRTGEARPVQTTLF